jgi:hypothetical protein
MNSTCISLCKPKVVEKGVEFTNLNAKGANISTPQGNKKMPCLLKLELGCRTAEGNITLSQQQFTYDKSFYGQNHAFAWFTFKQHSCVEVLEIIGSEPRSLPLYVVLVD